MADGTKDLFFNNVFANFFQRPTFEKAGPVNPADNGNSVVLSGMGNWEATFQQTDVSWKFIALKVC